ncbi:hypothetical protein V6N11_042758 [Hibiscus sabdariffa]|uniref:BTB domain-containing protein n=1 Tax=Hibiscus sabdariffa TaxID=183260 RepID=A0ABR2QXK2_9ROSI
MRFKTMSCRDVDEEFAVHASVLGGNPNRSEIMLDDLPDGTNTFESVVDFCYGFNIDVTATTIALLYRTMDMYLEVIIQVAIFGSFLCVHASFYVKAHIFICKCNLKKEIKDD